MDNRDFENRWTQADPAPLLECGIWQILLGGIGMKPYGLSHGYNLN